MPFCDFMCAVPATVEWGASGAAAYGEETAAVVSLGAAIAEATAAVTSLNLAVVGETYFSEQELLLGLDASTKTIQGEHAKDNLLSERLATNEMAAYKQLFQDVTVYEQSEINKRQISNREAASPTGEVAVVTATDLQQAITVKNEIAAKEPENQKLALEDMDKSKIATFFIQISRYMKAAMSGESPNPSDDASKEYKEIRDHMMMVYTRTMKSVDIKNIDQSIENKVMAAKASVKYIEGIEGAANRYAYSANSVGGSGEKKSLYGLLDDKVNNRLNDPNWYLAIKLANDSGLRRELVAMKAEENMILYQIYLAKESQNTYRAMRINNERQQR